MGAKSHPSRDSTIINQKSREPEKNMHKNAFKCNMRRRHSAQTDNLFHWEASMLKKRRRCNMIYFPKNWQSIIIYPSFFSPGTNQDTKIISIKSPFSQKCFSGWITRKNVDNLPFFSTNLNTLTPLSILWHLLSHILFAKYYANIAVFLSNCLFVCLLGWLFDC